MFRLLIWCFLLLSRMWGQGPVVLLSLDGQTADGFTARTMPRVWRLAQKGRTGRALPPFPSTTFNGHASLSTGCWPEHHGIVANTFADPGSGEDLFGDKAALLQREPLWVAATRSGVKTAVFSWPSGDGAWQGVEPALLKPYGGRPTESEALAYVDHALRSGATLVMAYLAATDNAGHHFGPGSPEVLRRLRAIDRVLAPWLRKSLAARPGLRIVLAGDHGMARMKRKLTLPTILEGLHTRIFAHGGSAYVSHPQASIRSEASKRLRAEGLEVWDRENLPETMHLRSNPRVGDLVALAPLGTWLSTDGGLEEDEGRVGAHAYLPSEPSMHGWLVVLGAGRGGLGQVPLWDIAPTIAHWLDIRWAQQPDGKPIPALTGSR
jgi:predicted AlkP superfamily pyrophosphatase or phosphodiesterase